MPQYLNGLLSRSRVIGSMRVRSLPVAPPNSRKNMENIYVISAILVLLIFPKTLAFITSGNWSSFPITYYNLFFSAVLAVIPKLNSIMIVIWVFFVTVALALMVIYTILDFIASNYYKHQGRVDSFFNLFNREVFPKRKP